MRHTTLPVALTITAFALAACGGGDSGSSGLPTIGSSTSTLATPSITPPPPSTPAASPTPATDPSPWTTLPTIPDGPNKGLNQGIVLASSVARTPAEQAAVQRYVEYWKLVMKASYDGQATAGELAAVTTGVAQKNLSAGLTRLSQRKARTVGWMSINVTRVEVTEGNAFIWACLDNGSYDVDAAGRRLERTPAGFDAFAALRPVNGQLVVSSAQSPRRSKACPQRAGRP